MKFTDPDIDLQISDLSHKQLQELALDLLQQVHRLQQFQDAAFAVVPNIDLDIEYWKRASA